MLIEWLDDIKILREHTRHLKWLDYKHNNEENAPLLFAINIAINDLYTQIANCKNDGF